MNPPAWVRGLPGWWRLLTSLTSWEWEEASDPHKLVRSVEWTMSSVNTTTLLNLYKQGQKGFARLWWCVAGPHLQGHTLLGTFPLLETSPLHLWAPCW